MVNNEVEPDEFYDETNDDLITEEELEHIHPDLDHNFPSPTMNSGIMTINQNDPEKIIDGPKDFHQYGSLFLSGHKRKKIHSNTIKVTSAQLDLGSNPHMFTDIKLFAYIRPVQCNVQIINDSKAPTKGFGLFTIKPPKTKIIIPP